MLEDIPQEQRDIINDVLTWLSSSNSQEGRMAMVDLNRRFPSPRHFTLSDGERVNGPVGMLIATSTALLVEENKCFEPVLKLTCLILSKIYSPNSEDFKEDFRRMAEVSGSVKPRKEEKAIHDLQRLIGMSVMSLLIEGSG